MDKKRDESFIKAALGGIGYVLLYWLIATIAGFLFAAGYAVFGRHLSCELSPQAFISALQSWTNEHADIIVISGNLIVMLVFLRINRKNAYFRDVLTQKVNAKTILALIGMGVCLSAAVNCIRWLVMANVPQELLAGDLSRVPTGTLPMRLLRSVIIAPVVEELVFHGTVFFKMRRGMPAVVAAFLTSIIMGVSHFGSVITTAYAAIVSMILILLICKSSSLLSGIIIHMIYNLTGMVLEYLPVSDAAACILAAAGSVASAALIVIVMRGYSDVKPAGKHSIS